MQYTLKQMAKGLTSKQIEESFGKEIKKLHRKTKVLSKIADITDIKYDKKSGIYFYEIKMRKGGTGLMGHTTISTPSKKLLKELASAQIISGRTKIEPVKNMMIFNVGHVAALRNTHFKFSNCDHDDGNGLSISHDEYCATFLHIDLNDSNIWYYGRYFFDSKFVKKLLKKTGQKEMFFIPTPSGKNNFACQTATNGGMSFFPFHIIEKHLNKNSSDFIDEIYTSEPYVIYDAVYTTTCLGAFDTIYDVAAKNRDYEAMAAIATMAAESEAGDGWETYGGVKI